MRKFSNDVNLHNETNHILTYKQCDMHNNFLYTKIVTQTEIKIDFYKLLEKTHKCNITSKTILKFFSSAQMFNSCAQTKNQFLRLTPD